MTAAFSAHTTNDGIFYEVTDMTDNFMVDIGFLAMMDEVDRQEQDEARQETRQNWDDDEDDE
jgi:hypothetical protein